MSEIRVSMPDDLRDLVKKRIMDLEISNSEYFRLLANLDISISQYNKINLYRDVLFDNILSLEKRLSNLDEFIKQTEKLRIN